MFKFLLTRLLRSLRSHAFRDVFAVIAARLCGASFAGSALLHYLDGVRAQAAIWSLCVVGVLLFVAAAIARMGDE